MFQKGFIPIIIILLVSVGLGGSYLIYQKFYAPQSISIENDMIACTQEAKLCPDGSSVGRSGPKCEFTPCPTTDETANWKTYVDNEAKFSFDYPSNWPVVKEDREKFGFDKVMADGTEFFNGVDFATEYVPNAGGQRMGYISISKIKDVNKLEDYQKVIDKEYAQLPKEIRKVQNKPETEFIIVSGMNILSIKRSNSIASFSPSRIYDYIIFNNGLIYNIVLLNSDLLQKDKEKNIKTFNQILSTFKFTQ